jgi:Domain of unknown function (DUF4126)
MLPVSLIFSSGVASGVNSYAAVLVLGLLGRFAHIAAIPPVLERPSVLAAAAVLYFGQFVVGKIPMLSRDDRGGRARRRVSARVACCEDRHPDWRQRQPRTVQQHRRQPARGPGGGRPRVVRRVPPGRRGDRRGRGAGGRHRLVHTASLADPPELAAPTRRSPAAALRWRSSGRSPRGSPVMHLTFFYTSAHISVSLALYGSV